MGDAWHGTGRLTDKSISLPGVRSAAHSQFKSAAPVQRPQMNVYYPPGWMNQLHDRAAGKGLGLYMPFRYAPVLLTASKKNDAGYTGTENTSRGI